MQELLEAEEREVAEQQHREKVEKELRTRLEVRESLFRQMQERQERLKQESEEDARYKEQVLTAVTQFFLHYTFCLAYSESGRRRTFGAAFCAEEAIEAVAVEEGCRGDNKRAQTKASRRNAVNRQVDRRRRENQSAKVS